MSLDILLRLSKQIDAVDNFLFDGDYNAAYRAARLLKSNINPKIKKKGDVSDVNKQIKDISEKISQYNGNTMAMARNKLKHELFYLISEFKERMLKIMQENDMYFASKEDAAHAILR